MNWENKKILITGITGLIGSNLGKWFFSQKAKIYAVDNYSYIDAELAKKKLGFLKDIEIIEGDASIKETWDKVPKDVEYIFHFAGPSSVTLFNRMPERCYKETVFSMYYVLEFAKKNGIKKVVYPTSGSNYAGNEMPHHERIYVKPRNLYAAAKVACEGLAHSYSDYVKSIGLRIFGGYGPGEEWKRDFASPVYLFIKECMEEKAPVIFGDGKQTRDFVFVEDIVKAIVAAAETDYIGIVNVGTGKPTSFNELLVIINKVLGKDIKPTHIPKEKNYVEDLRADTELMKKILNIEPHAFDQGIIKFVEYLKQG
jgi:nucleoside-diphosphate-sugar epimerase